MTLYGYARVSVREPEDKNLDLQGTWGLADWYGYLADL